MIEKRAALVATETKTQRRLRLNSLAQRSRDVRAAKMKYMSSVELRIRLDYLAQLSRSKRAAAKASKAETTRFQQPGPDTQHISTTGETRTEAQLASISLQQTELLDLQTNMKANGTHLYLQYILEML